MYHLLIPNLKGKLDIQFVYRLLTIPKPMQIGRPIKQTYTKPSMTPPIFTR